MVEIFLDEKVLNAKMPPAGSKVFLCDMTDLLAEFVPDGWIDRILAVIADNPPGHVPDPDQREDLMRSYFSTRPVLGNVWLGVSVESRRELDRLDYLRATPAALRFVSFEPLLGDLGSIDLTGINRVITGAESGSDARPIEMDWVRGIRDQCIAAGVPFFLKQDAKRGRKIFVART